MAKRLYKDCPDTHVFSVRIHRKRANEVKEVAERLGTSNAEVQRMIVETGLKALQAA
jgi:hypothetical protein